MRPFYILRFLYGIDKAELGKDYINYADMVLNWDTNIAPSPPTLIDYNAAEAKLTNMEAMKADARAFNQEQIERLKGASGVTYGLSLKDVVDLLLNKIFVDQEEKYFQTLSQPADEKVLEFLTLKQEQNTTNISNVNVPSLSPSEITTLLDDYNITEYYELREYGWYFLTQALGVSEEVAKESVIESHNFYASDDLSGDYVGEDVDVIIETSVPENNFWAYNLDSNVIFGDADVLIPIDSAKTYAASWYVNSSMSEITGGGKDIDKDGIYEIKLVMNIEEDSSINEARKTYVKIDINGTKHLISSGHQIICSGDTMTINVSTTMPLESGDNLKVYLNSDSGVGQTLNHASGYITITKTK